MTTFSPGDRVRFTEDYPHGNVLRRATGTVTYYYHFSGLTNVKLDGSDRLVGVYSHRLELIEEKQDLPFKVGDLVRSSSRTPVVPRGAVGFITRITDHPSDRQGSRYWVHWAQEGIHSWRFAEDLELIQEEPVNVVFDTKTASPIEQAQLFLGKKVLVKDLQGRVLRFGKVDGVKQGVNTNGAPGEIKITLRGLFNEFEAELTFTAYTFEEVE